MPFNFKSSGNQIKHEVVTTNITPSKIAIGIKTPIKRGSSDNDDLLAMNYSLADQIDDNLKNLILTNWGERLGLFNYGANLQPLLTELVSSALSQENFEEAVMNSISRSVSRWLPYVSPVSMQVNVDFSSNRNFESPANIILMMTYNIPNLNVTNKMLKVALRAV